MAPEGERANERTAKRTDGRRGAVEDKNFGGGLSWQLSKSADVKEGRKGGRNRREGVSKLEVGVQCPCRRAGEGGQTVSSSLFLRAPIIP